MGITTVFGNVPIDIATKNALILSEKSGLNIPVYTGASKPQERIVNNFPTFIHGNDGFGNINHSKSQLKKSNIDAEVLALLERCRSHTDVPLGVGFGISDRDDLQVLRGAADVAIIGTAALKIWQTAGPDGLKNFFHTLG